MEASREGHGRPTTNWLQYAAQYNQSVRERRQNYKYNMLAKERATTRSPDQSHVLLVLLLVPHQVRVSSRAVAHSVAVGNKRSLPMQGQHKNRLQHHLPCCRCCQPQLTTPDAVSCQPRQPQGIQKSQLDLHIPVTTKPTWQPESSRRLPPAPSSSTGKPASANTQPPRESKAPSTELKIDPGAAASARS